MFTTARKLVALSRSELLLLGTTTVLLLTSRALLTLVGLDRTHRALDRLVRVLPPYTTVRDPDTIPWAVAVMGAYVPIYFSCLMRAVVGERLFAANGHQTEIHFGVAKDDEFEAHAWVER
ncbi:MAG: lasso peptide biosynthesis B2 protein, partial [Halobacteriota archaeon]